MANFIKQSVTKIDIKDQLKKIEYCGRLCYQSRDKITEDSAKSFIERCVKRGHTSILEMGHCSIALDWDKYNELVKYRRIVTCNKMVVNARGLYNSTPFHQLVESDENRLSLLMSLLEAYNEEKIPQKYRPITLEIVTNRAISHQLVRHRVFSFLQQSDRYVRRTGDINFILPKCDTLIRYDMERFCEHSEAVYHRLLEQETAQVARSVLPMATSTTIIMTGFPDQWDKFLELRLSPKADPLMQELAQLIADCAKTE